MNPLPPAPLALHLDSQALKANWQWLARQSGPAACGAAIKADAYGLGAVDALRHLRVAGCRDFFVATWGEAAALLPHLGDAALSVLHGVRAEDMAFARATPIRPVLSSAAQVARWKQAGGGPCDLMVDTGMNRLGLDAGELDETLLSGLAIETLISHLACADEDHPLNAAQLERFRAVAGRVPARRYSLANSAGILLGADYGFDLTRPGLALYGGAPRPEAVGRVAQVARPYAQVLQCHAVRAGDTVGYGATFRATRDMPAAVLNIGYADGYLRGFSGTGAALLDGERLPVLGRVSMDLLIVDASAAPQVREGDWLEIEFDLPVAAAQSGLSQYELLTGMGRRYARRWV